MLNGIIVGIFFGSKVRLMGDSVGYNGVGLMIDADFSGGELPIAGLSGTYGGTLQIVFCVRLLSLESVTFPSTLAMTISEGLKMVADGSSERPCVE